MIERKFSLSVMRDIFDVCNDYLEPKCLNVNRDYLIFDEEIITINLSVYLLYTFSIILFYLLHIFNLLNFNLFKI